MTPRLKTNRLPRFKRGLRRPHQIPIFLNDEEHELLTRVSYKLRASKTNILRESFFNGYAVNGIENALMKLRQEQRNLPSEMFILKKKVPK